ncbi:hypothetical protein KJY73_15980 [Bowmanella sp. Y26]|uniref:hypothetical protein n=1 Tax=Bowmanella yangjiangensis TaxID=2811230 RepID=UPI001BDDBE6A|nr:hypothetical protein [Bowmanella yangjiangensis]MBT1065092.1 hypothetical protein [Bowmanella yangjiangensis]
MDRKFALAYVVTVSIIAFFVGRYSVEENNNSAYLDALVTTTNLANDRWGEVKLLEGLYESSQKSPSIAKSQFILAVTLMYRDDVRIRDVFNTDLGLNTGTISTNKAVLEFLEKYGFPNCSNLKTSALVACNLDSVEDDV